MIFITTAMACEAKSLTRPLGLKKLKEFREFPVYEGGDFSLVISGIGKTACATATAFLLTRFEANSSDLFINLGLCGTKSPHLATGQVVIANKITDHDSGRCFIPDMMWRHPFQEVSIETFSRCVEDGWGGTRISATCVDMEASGAFEAANFFLSPHQISIVKIVYDHLSPGKNDQAFVTDFLTMPCARISTWLRELPSGLLKEQEPLTNQDHELLRHVAREMRLTDTMSHKLRQLAVYCKLSGQELTGLLNGYSRLSCRTKKEGKMAFERLKKEILLKC